MTHSQLYRVPLSAILDSKLTPADVAKETEDLGQKPMSDGITVDKVGNVIITDVEHGGLTSFNVNTRKASTLVRSKDIRWADGTGHIIFTGLNTKLKLMPVIIKMDEGVPHHIYIEVGVFQCPFW